MERWKCPVRYVNVTIMCSIADASSRSRDITYSANYQPSGNSYLSVCGWTTNPLVEYYIIEDFGTYPSSGVTYKGTFNSDGATYDIYEGVCTNAPSIEGTATGK
jgi:endo-1,4-beta-xylanase